jgi:hypothetical protein
MRLMISFVLTAVLMMLSIMSIVEWWNGRGNPSSWEQKVIAGIVLGVLAILVYSIAAEATDIRPLRILAWSIITLAGLSLMIIGVMAIIV